MQPCPGGGGFKCDEEGEKKAAGCFVFLPAELPAGRILKCLQAGLKLRLSARGWAALEVLQGRAFWAPLGKKFLLLWPCLDHRAGVQAFPSCGPWAGSGS